MGAAAKSVIGIIVGLFLAAALIFAIMAMRAMNYGGPLDIEQVDLPSPPAIDTNLAVQHLGEAVRFKTVTYKAGDPQTLEAAQPWLDLHAWAEATYPNFHQAARKELVADYTLLYTWAGSDASLAPILLMAHQDVVPVNEGTEGDWGRPPFSGEVADGYIYGRGTLDDKGSMVALLEAAEALVRDGFQPKRTIILMFGHDEEVSGSGAQAGVALLKSRGVRPEMVLDEGFFVISPSPLSGKTMGFIGIAEKGYITMNLVSKATGGHSSTPPRNSANVQLSKAILALENNQMPADFSKSPVKELFQVAAADMPFMQRLAFANLWAMQGQVETALAKNGAGNAMIRTTTAPTMLTGSIKENVLPQVSEATINFRIHPNDTPEDVIAHVEKQISGIEGVTIAQTDRNGGIGSKASPVSATDNRAYAVLNAVAGRVGDGAPVAPGLVLGATDSRWTVEISDNIYRFAPANVGAEDLSGFHGTNERLAVENVRRLSEGYAQIMMAMGSE